MWDIFIQPPYWKCPECSKETFGVSSIKGNCYTRTCRNCEYTRTYELPLNKKKIVYLDQFAISNMMFALNPEANKQQKVDPIWRSLFCKIHKLCKLNLLVCPNSSYHLSESVVFSSFESLKRLYELLSSEVSFKTDYEIKEKQISTYAKAWIRGVEPTLDIKQAVTGDITGWISRLQISISWKESEKSLKEIRDNRQRVNDTLNSLFERWKSEKGKTVADWHSEQIISYKEEAIRQYIEHAIRCKSYFAGKAEIALIDLIDAPPLVRQVESAMDAFREGGVPEENVLKSTIEFFQSNMIAMVPFINISSWLLAALARNAANGQKEINQGTATDINAISTLSSYCDAMLIDNSSRELFKQVSRDVNMKCLFFSKNNLSEFLLYLDKIESEASDDLICRVREVYGANWEEPYTSLYRPEPTV